MFSHVVVGSNDTEAQNVSMMQHSNAWDTVKATKWSLGGRFTIMEGVFLLSRLRLMGLLQPPPMAEPQASVLRV